MAEDDKTSEVRSQIGRNRVRFFLLTFAFFILFLALYGWTMNADVQPADSGEFQLAAITLTVPHPPGYPLFTLLGWLFAQVPVGSPFARVTFLSAVASALTLAVMGVGVAHNADAKVPRYATALAMFVAMLALGTSTTFWAQATTTNIRSLTALFATLLVLMLLRAWQQPSRNNLIGFAIVLGLGVGHHLSLVFVGALFAFVVLVKSFRARLPWRDFRLAGLALIATQVVWLLLPLRNAAPSLIAHGDLASLNGFLNHVLARGFEGDLFYFIRTEPALFWDRLALTPTLLQFQFGVPLLLLMGLATLVVIWRQRRLGLILLAAFALHLFVTLTYRAPQTVEYAMPCWVIACALLGMGISEAGPLLMHHVHDASRRLTPPRITVLIGLIALILIGRDMRSRLPSFIALGQDRSTRTAAEAVLNHVEDNAIVWAQWHQATPIWALQAVEQLRPSVNVQYSYPAGAEPYETTFARRAAASAPITPAYITSYFEAELAAQNLQVQPMANAPAWRVITSAPSISNTLATWNGRIGLLSVQGMPQQIEAGAMFDVDVSWRAQGEPIAGDSITLRILRPDGHAATNADVQLTQTGIGFKRVALAAPYDLPAGEYDMLAGAYNGATIYQIDSGQPFVKVGQIQITPASVRLPLQTADQRAIPFANQMALTSYATQRNGNQLVIDLDWLALQPLTEDYKISVRLMGDNGFHMAHDGVPALGAVPTLKWIEGSRIADRHIFDGGDDAGPLAFEIVVYDQVTRIPLIPLDERFPDGVRIVVNN